MQKLLQLNIEGDVHIPLVNDFIAQQDPDIVCLQEVYEKDMDALCALPYRAFLMNMHRPNKTGEVYDFGVAIYSKIPFKSVEEIFYVNPGVELGVFDRTSPETIHKTSRRGVLFVELENGIRVATTHHTWTPHGVEEGYQVEDTHALVAALTHKNNYVLCGDFNIPRGINACYDILIATYDDCVPKTIESSMHIPLHRVRSNPEEAANVARYMVDYIFRTKDGPVVNNVSVHCGMSDHCALVGTMH